MIGDDDTPRPVLECARPLGSGAQAADAALFDEIDRLIESGQAADSIAAARILVAAGRVTGHGTPENVAQRLARRWREQRGVRIISQPTRESGSVGDMQTATPAQPDLAATVAGLLARVAALETQDAERASAVAALVTQAADLNLMLAQVIEDRVEIVRELIETREASTEVREAITRQTETMEHLVGANELRLAAMGAPRLRSVQEH